mmetsp:Transcript_28004/g.47047  ORF Transcript_28004/g.47047 Transcript_28004/m.47047 type:complete len:216 (-) Transcript_28004:903-1550(-)
MFLSSNDSIDSLALLPVPLLHVPLSRLPIGVGGIELQRGQGVEFVAELLGALVVPLRARLVHQASQRRLAALEVRHLRRHREVPSCLRQTSQHFVRNLFVEQGDDQGIHSARTLPWTRQLAQSRGAQNGSLLRGAHAQEGAGVGDLGGRGHLLGGPLAALPGLLLPPRLLRPPEPRLLLGVEVRRRQADLVGGWVLREEPIHASALIQLGGNENG